MRICKLSGALIVVALAALSVSAGGQQPPVLGYDDTPMQPNGKWHVHDPKRPHPPVVSTTAPAPSDATVLIGSRDDLSAWQMMADGSPVTWPIKDGVISTGKGMIRTKAEYTDFQLHVEFATPSEVKGDSQRSEER